jgi:acyl dehydratase
MTELSATPAFDVQTLESMRLYWEDMFAGFRYTTPSRTVTEADTVGFAGLSGDFNRIHTDAEYAAQSPYGQRIVPGLLVVSIMSGLSTRALVYQMIEPSLIAILEIRTRFSKPTFIGDTLHTTAQVISRKETSRPDRGVVTFQRHALNQRGVAVAECDFVMLMTRRTGQASL